jgi:hypothetical protein
MDSLYVYLPWGQLVLRLLVTVGCTLYVARRRTVLGWVLAVSSALLLVTPLVSTWIPFSGMEPPIGPAMQLANWTSLAFNLAFSVSLFAVLVKESSGDHQT